MMKKLVFIIFTCTLFTSCTEELETPVLDQIQGEWNLKNVRIEQYYDNNLAVDGNNIIEFEVTNPVSIDLQEGGLDQLNDPLILYLCTRQYNQFGGAYSVQNNGTQLFFDQGVGENGGLPPELMDISSLNDLNLSFENYYTDSLIRKAPISDDDREDYPGREYYEFYVTQSMAGAFGATHGYYRGINVNLIDFNQGYENGYLFGYYAGYYAIGGDRKETFYTNYLIKFVGGYVAGLSETGLDITGSSYDDGFSTGQLEGTANGFQDANQGLYGVPDAIKVIYTSEKL